MTEADASRIETTRATGIDLNARPVLFALLKRLPSRWIDRIAIALLLLGGLVLLAAYLIGPLGINSPKEGIVARHSGYSVVFQGSEVEQQIRLDGASLPVCSAESGASGSAVVLVIDNSGSMSGAPLQAARLAAQGFVDNLTLLNDGDSVAVVVFSDGAQTVFPFSIDPDGAKEAISTIGDGGGTAIHAGLAEANRNIQTITSTRTPIIILLSDGASDSVAALTEADIAKAAGTRIITIALGSADQQLLEQIASSPEDFYPVPDPSALQPVYDEIARGVGPIVARNVRIVERYDADRYELVTSGTQNPGVISRNFGVMTTSGREVKYHLQTPNIGWSDISIDPGTLEYTDCTGQIVTQDLPLGPRVLVLPPLYCFLLPFLFALLWALLRLIEWIWKNHFWEPPLKPRDVRTFPKSQSTGTSLGWVGPMTSWQPEPTLVIGLGGTGRWVLTHLKRNLLDAGGGVWRSQVQLLTLDTTAQEYVEEQAKTVEFGGVTLAPEETLVLTEDNLDSLITSLAESRGDEHSVLKAWFPAADYNQRLGARRRNLAHGTGGRRPMGRMALFRNLKDGLDASTLWQRLVTSINKVRQSAERKEGNKQLHIMVVASLAGGFGSSTVIDVAYLARRACEKIGLEFAHAEVTLMLVGNAPFDAQTETLGGDVLKQINTRAALREVERFLLSRNRPFPIEYLEEAEIKVDDEANVLRSQARNIIDDCWFIDGTREPFSLAERGVPPDKALFPMMADTLMVLMDTQAQQGGAAMGALRGAKIGKIEDKQLNLGQGVISSFASFTYRLPMRDLVNFLQIRFARELLALLIAGDREANLSQPVEAKQNKEAAGRSPQVHAYNFIAGQSGSGAGPLALQITSVIRAEGSLIELHEAIIDIAIRSRNEGRDTYLRREGEDFKVYLADALQHLLNGNSEQYLTSRTGKLAYTQLFLGELSLMLQQISSTQGWHNNQKHLPRWAPAVEQILPEILAEYKRIADMYRERLKKQEQVLLRNVYGDKQGDGANCVVDEIKRHDTVSVEALATLAEMKETRQYFLVGNETTTVERRRALLESWYDAYFAPQLGEALGFLKWDIQTEQPAIFLEALVNTSDPTEEASERTALSEGTIPRFAKALLKIGGYAGQQIWLEKIAVQLLADVVGPVARDDTQILELARRSAPALPYYAGGVGQGVEPSRLLWGPGGAGQHEWISIRSLLEQKLFSIDSQKVTSVSATDPFSVALLNLLDYVPLQAIELSGKLESRYQKYYGMDPQNQIAASPEPSATIASERRALEVFERRMLQLPERKAWLLTSLFVGALEHLPIATLYLQAYAANLIKVVPYSKSVGQNVLILSFDTTTLQLTIPEDEAGQVAVEVIGMQNFVLGTGQKTLTDQPLWTERHSHISNYLNSIKRDDLHTLWRQFDAKYRNVSVEGKLGFRDLVVCARIVVLAEMGML